MGNKDAIGLDPTVAHTDSPASTSDEADARLRPGVRAGEYEVVSHIGSGAMGDVYEGTHPVVGKRVAIKVIKHRLASSDEAHKRFIREARAVNQVDHPGVTDVFSFGTLDDGRLFLVMDLLEGESLGDRLRRDGPMAMDEFLAVLEQICSALDAAHAKGVIHRDLKPDNVFLARASEGPPRVYVLDFGIAKLLTDALATATSVTITGEGVWVGTPAYMAPEQWSSSAATARTDVYALGVMAYQMLSGAVPYQAESVPQMMEKHFHAEVPPITTSRGQALPRALDEVFRRALAKKPGVRFASAGALLAAVRDAAAGISVPRGRRAGAVEVSGADPQGARTPMLAGPMLAAALGGSVVVAAAIAVFVMMRTNRPADKPVSSAAATLDSDTARVQITSDPKGARVSRDGADLGITPTLVDVRPGERVRVRLSKPGYGTVLREATAKAGATTQLSATLPAVTGFEGTWRLPSGELRAFKRHQDRVVGYRLASEAGTPELLAFFEFQPSKEGTVRFGAAKEHVDERAPNEPTCRMSLRAEYRYHTASKELLLRRETVKYSLDDGRCTLHKRNWTSFEQVSRIASAADLSVAVSTAGGAAPIAPIMMNAGPPPPAQQRTPLRKGTTPPSVKRAKKARANKARTRKTPGKNAAYSAAKNAAKSAAKNQRRRDKKRMMKQRQTAGRKDTMRSMPNMPEPVQQTNAPAAK